MIHGEFMKLLLEMSRKHNVMTGLKQRLERQPVVLRDRQKYVLI